MNVTEALAAAEAASEISPAPADGERAGRGSRVKIPAHQLIAAAHADVADVADG